MFDPNEETPATPSQTTAAAWRPRLVLVSVFVAALVLFFALGLHDYLAWDRVRGRLDAWREQVRENLAAAVALFFLVYVGVTALSLPFAGVLSLTAGALFGRWVGTAVVSLAATGGATLAFLSSRYLLRDWVQRRFGGRLAAVNRGVERDGAYYLFTLRLVPAVPFFLINLGMGLTPLRTRTFAWVTFVGMVPGAFLFVNAGTALANVNAPADVLSPTVLASLALLGVVPLAFRLLARRRSGV